MVSIIQRQMIYYNTSKVLLNKMHLKNMLPFSYREFYLNASEYCAPLLSKIKDNNFNNIPVYLNSKRKLWKTLNNKSKFGKYSLIKAPSEVIVSAPVPDYIIKPPYAETGRPPVSPSLPEIKSEEQIKGMIEACRRAREVLHEVGNVLKIGLTTEEIDIVVREKSFSSGCYPSPLNYKGFPKSCCTSVNNVACHGIPDIRPLEDGDIISVDITVYYKGYHGDCCETFLIGDVDEPGKHLVKIAKQCRDGAIEICGPDSPFADIGTEVEGLAREENLTVVPAFMGHGIGYYFHGPPDIYHFFNDVPGVMRPGMTFTVEPVITQGNKQAIILEDGWTVVMMDDARAAQFEHTILITDHGHEILTYY